MVDTVTSSDATQIEIIECPVAHKSGERRLIINLMGLWQGRRRGRMFPALEDFNLKTDEDAVRFDVWPSCFTGHLSSDGHLSALSDVGDRIAYASGVRPGRMACDAVPDGSLLAVALRPLTLVWERSCPVVQSGDFETKSGQHYKFRSILLPVSQDGSRVSHIVGAANAKRRSD